MKTLPGQLTLRCDVHGRVVWLGDVICGTCGRVYICQRYDADGKGHFADLPEGGLCGCGLQLFNEGGAGRAVCRSCARRCGPGPAPAPYGVPGGRLQ